MEPDSIAAGGSGARGAPGLYLDRRELAAIFAGGFIGAVARSALVQSLPVGAGEWPWATFAVNMLAALALGYFLARLQELPPHANRRSFLTSGVCGAMGTFSTMMLELLRMIDAHEWLLGSGYAAASVSGGLGAVLLATKLGRRVRIDR